MLHFRPRALNCTALKFAVRLNSAGPSFQPPCSAEYLQDNSSARTTPTGNMSRDGYPASPLARWLLPSNELQHSSTETQFSLLRVGTCLLSRCLETGCITPLFYCCVRVLLSTAVSVAQQFLHTWQNFLINWIICKNMFPITDMIYFQQHNSYLEGILYLFVNKALVSMGFH
jgi:hypothetical protein